MGVIDDLAEARRAYERREWVTAYTALSDVDDERLDAGDFVRLATSALLVGRRNDCIQALQRAYRTHLDRGEVLAAVTCGAELALVLLETGEPSVSSGWVSRCERLLDDVAGDVAARGYVVQVRMFRHIFSGELEAAVPLAAELTACGRRFGDADLLANGLNAQGRMLVYAGRVAEGMALLDEALVGVTTGEVSPVVAGHVYCSMIEACQEVSDFARAAEWTSQLTSWIDAQPGLVAFTGQCAVHRGQIMRVRGAFPAAVEELTLATERYLATGTPAPAGLAMAECGEVLRILGDLPAAESAYERAAGFGYEGQPGRALLWLDRGRGSAAAGAVRRLLAEPAGPVQRAQLLPGAVEVLLGVDEAADATVLADELDALATSFGSSGLQAVAAYARGHALLAGGQPGPAVSELRRAAAGWQALEAPYEVARTRLRLGLALRELGDEQSAVGEMTAACTTFRSLGAVPAEREAARLLDPARPAGLTEREVEVLRLVASGSSNPEIAAALVLSEKTVARHLSNIFTKLDVRTRTAAAAYAFEHRLT